MSPRGRSQNETHAPATSRALRKGGEKFGALRFAQHTLRAGEQPWQKRRSPARDSHSRNSPPAPRCSRRPQRRQGTPPPRRRRMRCRRAEGAGEQRVSVSAANRTISSPASEIIAGAGGKGCRHGTWDGSPTKALPSNKASGVAGGAERKLVRFACAQHTLRAERNVKVCRISDTSELRVVHVAIGCTRWYKVQDFSLGASHGCLHSRSCLQRSSCPDTYICATCRRKANSGIIANSREARDTSWGIRFW